MKRLILSMALAVACSAVGAQTLNVRMGNIVYSFPASQTGDMTYANGSQLSIMGCAIDLANVTEMYVDTTAVSDNTVFVCYDGSTAQVRVAGNIARYVTPTVSGANVSIVQGSDVGEDTCGEIIYQLEGASDDGSFYMEGAYKATIELHGLTLTSTTGAAIDIQNGKRINLSVKSETVNTITDCTGGEQKGCLVCKGHLELKGKGTLNVYGQTSHAIYAKEYVEMKNCTVNVLSAQKDGINCNQYLLLESGVLDISGVGDDAVQVSFKDDTNRDAEDTGSITIAGGMVKLNVTATAAKGLKADGSVAITGGTIDIATTGGGEWDDEDAKTKASTCISADQNVSISGGAITLLSSGSGGKGISCDSLLTIDGGTINVSTTGGLYAYVNGTAYDNYTGNTDYLDSDYTSSPKGIKADGEIIINGGNISVSTKGNNAEGIESKGLMTINDGTITVHSYDDGLNSSNHMYLNGGDITVVATNNDAIDSNGNLYINGGTIRAFGASTPEGGIDANEEEGYTVIISGGTLIAVGGSNSTPSNNESTQAYVSTQASIISGSTVTLVSGTDTLATFTIPENYSTNSSGSANRPGMGGPGGNPGGPGSNSGSAVLITCPGLTSGSRYTLNSGTQSTTVTATTSAGNNRPW